MWDGAKRWYGRTTLKLIIAMTLSKVFVTCLHRFFLIRYVYYFFRLSIQRNTSKEIKNLLHHRDDQDWGCWKTGNPLYLHVFALEHLSLRRDGDLQERERAVRCLLAPQLFLPREQFNRTRMLVCQVVEGIPETAITAKGRMINSTIALKQKLRAHGFIKEAITQRCEYLSRNRPPIHFDMFSNKTYYATRFCKANERWRAKPLIRFSLCSFLI